MVTETKTIRIFAPWEPISHGVFMSEHHIVRDELFPDCPIRNVLSRVGDKWSLLVLYSLQQAPSLSGKAGDEALRFKELQRSIPDISQKSLTQTLRMLEEDGFIHREVYPEVPPRVEYSLTERANSFLPLVGQLISWAKENMEDIVADREKMMGK